MDDDRILELQIKLEKNYLRQKKIIAELKELMKDQSAKNIFDSQEKRENDFFKKRKVPKKIKSLLKIKEDKMTQTEVTRLFYEYCSKNKLIDAKNKSIKADHTIKKIFNLTPDKQIDFYNLQSYLRQLYD
jgi:hypothetical protein